MVLFVVFVWFYSLSHTLDKVVSFVFGSLSLSLTPALIANSIGETKRVCLNKGAVVEVQSQSLNCSQTSVNISFVGECLVLFEFSFLQFSLCFP